MISPEYASHLGRTKIMIHCPPKRKRDRRPAFCGAAAPLWLAAPGRDGSPEASGGRSLRTWVWEFWVKPSDAGRGPAGPSSDCGLAARTRAGGWGAGWCPQAWILDTRSATASRGPGLASRPRGAKSRSRRCPGLDTRVLGAQPAGRGPRTSSGPNGGLL